MNDVNSKVTQDDIMEIEIMIPYYKMILKTHKLSLKERDEIEQKLEILQEMKEDIFG